MDEEVARTDGGELANTVPSDVGPADGQFRELAAQPEQRHAKADERDAERERAEQDEPAAARDEHRHEHGVEDRRDEVAEILNVETLVAAEQVVDEPERETSDERERDEERRQPRFADEPVGRVDQQRHDPGEQRPRQERHDANHRVERQGDGRKPVRVLGRAACHAPRP